MINKVCLIGVSVLCLMSGGFDPPPCELGQLYCPNDGADVPRSVWECKDYPRCQGFDCWWVQAWGLPSNDAGYNCDLYYALGLFECMSRDWGQANDCDWSLEQLDDCFQANEDYYKWCINLPVN